MPWRISLLLLGGADLVTFPDPDPDDDPDPEPEPEVGDADVVVVVGLSGLPARTGDAMASAASAAPATSRWHSRNDRGITRPYLSLPLSSLSTSVFLAASAAFSAAFRSARA